MADAKPKKPGGRPDLASLGGLVVAIGGIMTGLLMEGGKVKDVQQFTAALIVLGGTIGAVMLTTPMGVLVRAARQLVSVFFDHSPSRSDKIDEIIEYATQARKKGIVSLEQQAAAIQDPFLQKALTLAVDGYSGQNALSYVTPGFFVSPFGKWVFYPAYQISNVSRDADSYLFEVGYTF